MVMELVSEEQVLNAVKSKGPVVPMDIRQITKAGDSITIGATLSTLSARGLVLITHIKRGGSPFYYVKGQEEKLAELSKFLNEKDRRTFEALKQNKIIRDKNEEPLTRISLRNIPDFAKSIALDINGVQEIIWRWYMLSDEDAIALLKSGKENKKEEKTDAKEKEKEEKAKEKEMKREEKTGEKVEVKETEVKKESSAENTEFKDSRDSNEVKSKEHRKKEKTEKTEKTEKENLKENEFLEVTEDVQQKLVSGENPQIIAHFNDGFITKVGSFLFAGKIVVKEAKQIKKGAEYDLVVEIPTPVGNVEYFCKAKSKKKCNEGDLSSASVQGQNMRLPVLFITTGEVVKKAKEKLKADYKGMIIKEI